MQTGPRNYTASGHVSVEVGRTPAGWYVWETRGPDQPLPPVVSAELDRLVPGSDYEELSINFTARGSYDPGCYSGAPEDCYPAEHDEERTVDSVEVCHSDPSQRKRFSVEAVAAMAEAFADDIEAADLDVDEE